MINQIEEYISKNDEKNLIDIAFNIKNKEEFDLIFNYFLARKDAFNIGELLSIASEYADIREAAKKIVATKNEELIFYLLHFGPILDIVDAKFFEILRKSI